MGCVKWPLRTQLIMGVEENTVIGFNGAIHVSDERLHVVQL